MKYMLRHVKPAPEGIVWDVSKERNFEELLATKRESAPGPDRLPCSTCRHAGGIGTRFLFEAYQHLFRGGHPPTGFPASRTVLIWKSREVDEAATIASCPACSATFTLCNCDSKNYHDSHVRGDYESMYRSASISLRGDLPKES